MRGRCCSHLSLGLQRHPREEEESADPRGGSQECEPRAVQRARGRAGEDSNSLILLDAHGSSELDKAVVLWTSPGAASLVTDDVAECLLLIGHWNLHLFSYGNV
ncbi:hypothetical protein NN561_019557 [Cricetulus griseus]